MAINRIGKIMIYIETNIVFSIFILFKHSSTQYLLFALLKSLPMFII